MCLRDLYDGIKKVLYLFCLFPFFIHLKLTNFDLYPKRDVYRKHNKV